MPRFQPRRAVENLILNPHCLIAQEGTSFAAMADADYVIDGFQYLKSGAMVHTGSQATDHPAATGRLYDGYKSLKLDCTTADASIAAGEYCGVSSYVEGFHALRCYEVPCVLTFWHKHTKTGVYCVAIRNAGADRSLILEYSQAVADTWEKATLIIPASPSAGTWNQSNGIGFQIVFMLACGSTYQTTAGSWNTGDFYATASQVNACDNVANNFQLAQVALYPGSRDLGFYAPDIEQQLQLAQRYYEKSYDLGTVPGTATGVGSCSGVAVSSVYLYAAGWGYKVRKRSTPTITLYNTQNGSSGQYSQYNTSAVFQSNQAGSAYDLGEMAFGLNCQGNITAGNQAYFQYTADSRF